MSCYSGLYLQQKCISDSCVLCIHVIMDICFSLVGFILPEVKVGASKTKFVNSCHSGH
jgi:hypothetical protein